MLKTHEANQRFGISQLQMDSASGRCDTRTVHDDCVRKRKRERNLRSNYSGDTDVGARSFVTGPKAGTYSITVSASAAIGSTTLLHGTKVTLILNSGPVFFPCQPI